MPLWGKTDQVADKPKYLNTADAAATSGISEAEAGVAANKAKGVAHAGWVTHTTYTDAQGNTRNKSEVLVAMSSITGDNNADDTTIGVDPVITISAQPQNASVADGEGATFSVTATVTGTGTLTYQWQLSTNGGSTWTNLAAATAATLEFEEVALADNNNRYRVIVSAAGAANATSNAATLTVTA